MNEIPLPSAKAVRDLLSELFGRDVDVAQSDLPAEPRLDPRSTVAVYRDDAKNTAGVVTADLTLSTYLAAGLSLVSKDSADEAVSAGTLPATYAENVREVLSIVGTLLNSPVSRAVRMGAIHLPGEPVPFRVSDRAVATGRRLDLQVSISGYGSGQMSVVV
jgi:hypothetical protein